jgi:hypothetical protein
VITAIPAVDRPARFTTAIATKLGSVVVVVLMVTGLSGTAAEAQPAESTSVTFAAQAKAGGLTAAQMTGCSPRWTPT